MEEYKGYSIVSSRDTIGYEVEYVGRGSAHMSLRGSFTDKRTAKKMIDIYVTRKEEEDDKKLQRSRSEQVQRRVKYRRQPSNNS